MNDFPTSFPSGAYAQANLAGSVDGFIAEFCFDETLTSIREQVISNELKMFPNPTTGEVIIDMPANNSVPTSEKLHMFNALGQRMSSFFVLAADSNMWRIDISLLPSGIYYYQLGDYTGNIVKM